MYPGKPPWSRNRIRHKTHRMPVGCGEVNKRTSVRYHFLQTADRACAVKPSPSASTDAVEASRRAPSLEHSMIDDLF